MTNDAKTQQAPNKDVRPTADEVSRRSAESREKRVPTRVQSYKAAMGGEIVVEYGGHECS